MLAVKIGVLYYTAAATALAKFWGEHPVVGNEIIKGWLSLHGLLEGGHWSCAVEWNWHAKIKNGEMLFELVRTPFGSS